MPNKPHLTLTDAEGLANNTEPAIIVLDIRRRDIETGNIASSLVRLHVLTDNAEIAGMNGLGYQTLMRQVLKRFADCEKKQMLRDLAAEYAKEQGQENPDEELRKAA